MIRYIICVLGDLEGCVQTELSIDSFLSHSEVKVDKFLASDMTEKGLKSNLSFEETWRNILQSMYDNRNKKENTYISFVRPGDILDPSTPTHIYNEINHSNASVIYTDHVELEIPSAYDIYYKPDYNRELLYCQNYMDSLAIYNLEYLIEKKVLQGNLQENVPWMLALEATQYLSRKEVRHIPKALIKSYNSLGYKDSPEFLERAKLVIGKTSRTVKEFKTNENYILPIFQPDESRAVTIVIPIKDQVHFLKSCLKSILKKTTYKNYKILVVNNRSSEPETFDYLNEIWNLDNVEVVEYDKEFNFAQLHNDIISQIKTPYTCMLNSDVEIIHPDWLTQAVGVAEDPGVGLVGGKLLFSDNSIQHAGVLTGVVGIAVHAYSRVSDNTDAYFHRAQLLQNYRVLTGACLLFRTQTWLDAGGMDVNFTVAFNDVDFSLKMDSLGYYNVYQPLMKMYHYESKTRGYEDNADKQKRFSRETALLEYKWGTTLFDDPYYNDNLKFASHVYLKSDHGGAISPYRTSYNNSLLDTVSRFIRLPNGLEGVDKTHLPVIPTQTIRVSAKLHRNHDYSIKKVIIPYHEANSKNDQPNNLHNQWKLTYFDPGNRQWKAVEGMGSNSSVTFVLPEPISMKLADRLDYKLNLIKNRNTIFIQWYYANDDFLFIENNVPKYTRVFNTIVEVQHK